MMQSLLFIHQNQCQFMQQYGMDQSGPHVEENTLLITNMPHLWHRLEEWKWKVALCTRWTQQLCVQRVAFQAWTLSRDKSLLSYQSNR